MGSNFGTGPLDKQSSDFSEYESFQSDSESNEVEQETLTPTIKTQGIVRSCLDSVSNAYHFVTRSVRNAAALGVAKSVKAVVFSSGTMKRTTEVNQAYLEGFTGNDQFGKFLDTLSSRLSEKISENAVEEGSLQYVLKSNQSFVNDLLKCLISEVAVNVAKDLHSKNKPTDTLSIIVAIVETIMNCSQKVLKSPHLMTDPVTTSVREAAADATSEMLKQLVPFGGSELPMMWGSSSLVWNKLKYEILPDALIKAARLIRPFDSLSKKQELETNVQEEFLLQLVEQSRTVAEDVAISTYENPATQTYLVKQLFKLLTKTDKENDKQLYQWVDHLLSDARDSHPEILYFFTNFAGDQAESFVSAFLFNVMEKLDPENQGFAAAMRRFIEIGKSTFTQQHPLIQNAYAKLTAANTIPETNERYLKLFLPMVSLIEEIAGTDILWQKLPEKYREKGELLVRKVLTKLIAQNYQSEIAPVMNFLIQESERSGDGISPTEEQPREIGPLTEYLTNYISREKSSIAQMLAQKVVGKLPAVEHRLAALVQTQLEEPSAEHQVPPDLQPEVSTESQELPLEDAGMVSKELEDKTQVKEIVLSRQQKELAAWLETWLVKQYELLEVNNDPILSTVWKSVDALIDDLVSFVLTGKGFDTSHIPSSIKVSDYAEILLQFLETNGEELRKHFITINATGKSPGDDPVFVSRFNPLCEALSRKLMLDDENAPIPKFIQQLALTFINQEVPQILAKKYNETLAPLAAMEGCKNDLKILLGGKDANEETDKTVTQIENLCEFLSDKITGSVETVAFDLLKKQTGFDLTKFSLPKFQLLREVYIKKVLKAFLMELIVNYFKKVDAAGKPLSDVSLSQLMTNLASLLEKHLKENPEALFQAAWNEDKDLQKQALREAFTPMAKDLVDLFRSEEASNDQSSPVTLPLPSLLKGLWEDVETIALPDILGSMFLDVTKLATKKAELQQTAQEITGANYVPEACRVLGHWVADFLPPYLFRDRDDVVQTLYAAITKSIGNTNTPSASAIVEFLNTHGEEYKKRICEDLFSFFAPDDQVAQLAGPITKEYVETVLLQAFNGIVQRVQEKESGYQNPGDFLLNISIKLITVIQSHFRTLNRAAENEGIPVLKMSHQQHLAAFRRQLHGGIPQSATGIKSKQTIKECLKILTRERKRLEKLTDPVKIQTCKALIEATRKRLVEAKATENDERLPYFTEMAKTMLELSGIKGPDDLPFPAPLKNELWALVEQDLFPIVFRELLGAVLEPKNLNSILISGLEMLNEALDRVPDPDEQPYVAPADEEQVRLNIACGGLIQQLAAIIPRSLIKTAFKIDRIKAMSTESLGASVRQALGDNMTLMMLINSGIESGLANLHPGAWQQTENGAVFTGEGGEIKFTNPLNADQVELNERKALKDFEISRVKLKKLMVQTTHTLVKQNFKGFFKWPLIKFKKIWDKCVDKVFGKYTKPIREYFSWLGTKAFFRLIEIIFTMASIPFRRTAGFFLDLYLGLRVEQVVRNLELDIHENLLYKLTDAFLAALKSNESILDKKVIDELVAEAGILDAEERARVALYQERFNPVRPAAPAQNSEPEQAIPDPTE